MGKLVVAYTYGKAGLGGQIQGWFQGKLRPATLTAWQLKTWAAFREAAQANFDRNLTLARDRKAFLEAQIAQFDALTLRKMEHEEVMKWVLEWLLPSSPLASSPIHDLAIDWPPPERPASTIPLFRLLDSRNGDHFFTTSESERDKAITDYYYQDQGVAGDRGGSQSRSSRRK